MKEAVTSNAIAAIYLLRKVQDAFKETALLN
jgi:hypothetical protein